MGDAGKLSSLALLAGGLATRLYPATLKTPKAMLEVGGRPFIAHQLELFRRNGIERVVLCAGYLSGQLEEYVGDGKTFGLKVEYSYDGEPLKGTGGALQQALPLLGEHFFVMYGDSYLTIDFQAVAAEYFAHSAQGLMTVFRNQNQWDRSNVAYARGKIVTYDKKNQTPEMDYIDYGLGILNQHAFAEFAGQGVFDLAEVYQRLVRQGKLYGYEAHERFYEIGSRQGLEETRNHLQPQA